MAEDQRTRVKHDVAEDQRTLVKHDVAEDQRALSTIIFTSLNQRLKNVLVKI